MQTDDIIMGSCIAPKLSEFYMWPFEYNSLKKYSLTQQFTFTTQLTQTRPKIIYKFISPIRKNTLNLSIITKARSC